MLKQDITTFREKEVEMRSRIAAINETWQEKFGLYFASHLWSFSKFIIRYVLFHYDWWCRFYCNACFSIIKEMHLCTNHWFATISIDALRHADNAAVNHKLHSALQQCADLEQQLRDRNSSIKEYRSVISRLLTGNDPIIHSGNQLEWSHISNPLSLHPFFFFFF